MAENESKPNPTEESIIYDPIPTGSRIPKSSGEDGYFAQTLATPLTMPTCRTLRRRHLALPLPALPPSWPSPTVNPPPPVHPADLIMILDLVAPGVCGHPATAHGGVLATVVDECMSLAAYMYARSSSSSPQTVNMFTSQLDIRYKKPVAVPGQIEARAKVLARAGRKFWVRAQILQGGEITTDAMGFWLLVEPSL